MSAIGNGVSLRGLHQEEFNYVFNLASAIVAADVGKAVTLDTSAANTVKLAGDGDPIIGYLESVEDRTVEGISVGTVATKGVYKFTYTGTAPSVGDTVVGSATAGAVKDSAASNMHINYVVAVDATNTTVDVVLP